MFTDLPLEQLCSDRSEVLEPDAFDESRTTSLAQAREEPGHASSRTVQTPVTKGGAQEEWLRAVTWLVSVLG